MVYESQYLVPDKLRDALLDRVRVLEDVPEEDMDWHPGWTLSTHPSTRSASDTRTSSTKARKDPLERA